MFNTSAEGLRRRLRWQIYQSRLDVIQMGWLEGGLSWIMLVHWVMGESVLSEKQTRNKEVAGRGAAKRVLYRSMMVRMSARFAP